MNNSTVFFYERRAGKRRYAFFPLILLLFFTRNIYAAETDPFYRELSLGLGADANGYTIDGFSLGGLFTADYRFLPFLAVGLKSGFGYDLKEITHVEAEAFARWYFFNYPKLLNRLAAFAQLEGGAASIWEINGSSNIENKWSFSGALAVGARLKLPLNFYVESYVRGGYPFIWDVSVVFGYTITSKPSPAKAVKTEAASEVESESPTTTESGKPVEQAETAQPAAITKPPSPAAQTTTVTTRNDVAAAFGDIIFRDNGADFTDLDGALIIANNQILDRIAEFLKQNPEYKLRIEGYANPVQSTPRAKAVEEERFLIPISRERANTILELLAERGISRSRLTAVGLGGQKTVVDLSDKDNWQKNRRVEFVLSK
jgi:outer membrane protein OmpA-like peptidoglycan-associated protein